MMRAKKLVAVLVAVAFVCHETSARLNDPKEAEQLDSAETFSSSSATEASQPDETKSLRAAAIGTATATADTAEERAPKKIAEVALGGLAHGLGVVKKPRVRKKISDENLEIMRILTKSVSNKPSKAEVDKIIAEASKIDVALDHVYGFFSGHEALKHITLRYVRNVALKTRMVKHEKKINDLFLHRHDAKEVKSNTRLSGKRAEEEVESISKAIEEWPEKYGKKLDSLDEILLEDADPQTFIQDVMSTTSPDDKEQLEYFILQRIKQHNEIKTKVDELFADQVLPSKIYLELTRQRISKGDKMYIKRYIDLRLKKRVDEELEKRVDEELKKRVEEVLENSLNAGKDAEDVKVMLMAPPLSLPESDVKHYTNKYREQQDMVSLTLNSF